MISALDWALLTVVSLPQVYEWPKTRIFFTKSIRISNFALIWLVPDQRNGKRPRQAAGAVSDSMQLPADTRATVAGSSAQACVLPHDKPLDDFRLIARRQVARIEIRAYRGTFYAASLIGMSAARSGTLYVGRVETTCSVPRLTRLHG